jgi:hypothetical protein
MDYSDDSCMDEFSSNQFDRMLAMYDKFRAEEEAQEVVSNPGNIFIYNASQTSDQVVVVQSLVIVQSPVVVENPVVVEPVSTCNKQADWKFCSRDVQCCSGTCYFWRCQPTRR